MERNKRTIVLLLLIIVGLGGVEKDLLFMHNCAIATTATTCNSGADSHSGIHHHAHVTECDALNDSYNSLFSPYETTLHFSLSCYLFIPKAPTIDSWLPPKATS